MWCYKQENNLFVFKLEIKLKQFCCCCVSALQVAVTLCCTSQEATDLGELFCHGFYDNQILVIYTLG